MDYLTARDAECSVFPVHSVGVQCKAAICICIRICLESEFISESVVVLYSSYVFVYVQLHTKYTKHYILIIIIVHPFEPHH